ncbi:MAG: hypothetical protein WBD75_12390 [Phycisphaerae bacterium]
MAVLAYHVIFGAYGFWLPNDPRGSWSVFVASWELSRFGKATKTEARRSVAKVAHGFARARTEGGYRVHACSILPEHVHLVIGRSDRAVERVVGHLKARATVRLKTESLWPEDGRPVWARKGRKVFLDCLEDVRRAVAYVEANPLREGKPRQRWLFVEPYDV